MKTTKEEVVVMCTILGQNIRLVRPERVKRHSATGAWKRGKQTGRKTHKLTTKMKQVIAREMGFDLREVQA